MTVVVYMVMSVFRGVIGRRHVAAALLRDRAHRLARHGVVVTRAATDIHFDCGGLGTRC